MLEYIIIGLLVLLIVLITIILVLFLSKKSGNNNDNSNELKLYFQKETNSLRLELFDLVNRVDRNNEKHLGLFSEDVTLKINKQLNDLNEKVNSKLGEGSNKTQETFVNVIERLTKIDATQSSLNRLSDEVINLNQILTDKKARGSFGEVQLNQILTSIFGNNKVLFEKQKRLSNNKMVDVIIHAPKPLGSIGIDSKFPLENYNKMVDQKLSKPEQEQGMKSFKNDVKKHIDDIASKYIIINETAEHAMMFIPAESVFAEITAHHDDLVQYAQKKYVWLVSPTTLLSTLSIIQTMYSNIEQDLHAELILDELRVLATEFERYSERWDKLRNSADSLTRNINNVYITSDKISKKFSEITNVEFDKKENIALIDN